MDLRKILISTSFLIFFIANFAFSYDNLGTSARAVGMGNAFVAIADDPSAVFYNPAGLARLRGVHFSMMYDRGSVWGYSLEEKPYVGFGSVVYPLSGNSGVFAFSGSRKASWSSQSQIVGQNILSLSYARSLGPMSSLGLNAKLLSNSKVDKKTGFEMDLGFLFPISDRFSFGLAGENLLGTDMTPDTGVIYASPQMPTLFNFARRQYKAGLAVSLPTGNNSTRIAYDVIVKDKKNFSTSTPYLNSLGIEQGISLIPGNTFFLRAGYTFGKDYNQDYKQWAWGISYKMSTNSNTIQFDYSYQSYPFQTSTSLVGDHRLGLTIGFGFAKHPDYFSKNKSQTKFVKQEEIKKDKTAEIPKDVKPSTIVEQTDKPASDQTLVKKEEPKITQPTTPTSTPSTPMVTTPSSTATKVATTEKPKTTVTTPVPTPSSTTKTTSPEKPKPTTVTQTPTVSPETKKSTPPATTPTTPAGKTKDVSVTKAPVTKSTTPVTPSEQPKATTVAKTPTTTSTTKVTPTEKPKPTPAAKTPTSTTETKVSPTNKSKDVTLAQVTPKTDLTPTPAVQKTKEVFEPIKVSANMEKIKTQSVRKKSNSYMFIFKVNLNDEEDAIVDWKVYVCSAMPKSNDWEQISSVLIKTLEGRGNLPSGILWEARAETQVLPSIYYALQIRTSLGKKYFTAWQTGKMSK